MYFLQASALLEDLSSLKSEKQKSLVWCNDISTWKRAELNETQPQSSGLNPTIDSICGVTLKLL